MNVLSYNVLAHYYTIEEGKAEKLWPDSPFNILKNFDYRATRVIREITEQDKLPDIICLQEIDNYESYYQLELIEYGYDCRLVYRKGTDAVLIGWNRKMFDFVDMKEVQMDDLAERYGEDGKLFKKGNVLNICLLQHKKSQK